MRRFLRSCSPDGLTAEERLFRDGMRYTKIKLFIWVSLLIIGCGLIVTGWYFSYDLEKWDVTFLLWRVGGLVVFLACAGIVLYNNGLRCLEKAELLYHTRHICEYMQKSMPGNPAQDQKQEINNEKAEEQQNAMENEKA